MPLDQSNARSTIRAAEVVGANLALASVPTTDRSDALYANRPMAREQTLGQISEVPGNDQRPAPLQKGSPETSAGPHEGRAGSGPVPAQLRGDSESLRVTAGVTSDMLLEGMKSKDLSPESRAGVGQFLSDPAVSSSEKIRVFEGMLANGHFSSEEKVRAFGVLKSYLDEYLTYSALEGIFQKKNISAQTKLDLFQDTLKDSKTSGSLKDEILKEDLLKSLWKDPEFPPELRRSALDSFISEPSITIKLRAETLVTYLRDTSHGTATAVVDEFLGPSSGRSVEYFKVAAEAAMKIEPEKFESKLVGIARDSTRAPEERAAAAQAVTEWGSALLKPELQQWAEDKNTPAPMQLAAAEAPTSITNIPPEMRIQQLVQLLVDNPSLESADMVARCVINQGLVQRITKDQLNNIIDVAKSTGSLEANQLVSRCLLARVDGKFDPSLDPIRIRYLQEIPLGGNSIAVLESLTDSKIGLIVDSTTASSAMSRKSVSSLVATISYLSEKGANCSRYTPLLQNAVEMIPPLENAGVARAILNVEKAAEKGTDRLREIASQPNYSQERYPALSRLLHIDPIAGGEVAADYLRDPKSTRFEKEERIRQLESTAGILPDEAIAWGIESEVPAVRRFCIKKGLSSDEEKIRAKAERAELTLLENPGSVGEHLQALSMNNPVVLAKALSQLLGSAENPLEEPLQGARQIVGPFLWAEKGNSIPWQSSEYRHNFIEALQHPPENIPELQKGQMKNYGDALAWAEGAGITNPFRYTPSTLIVMSKQSGQPVQTDQPVLLVVMARDDWNGALMNVAPSLQQFVDHGYRIEVREVESKSAITAISKNGIARDADGNSVEADQIMIVGHGSRESVSFGAADPRLNKVSGEGVLTIDDLRETDPFAGLLKKNGQVFVVSCSTAEGEKTAENFTTSLRNEFPDALPDGITGFAAPLVTRTLRFEFDKNGRATKMMGGVKQVLSMMDEKDGPRSRLAA